MVQQLQELMQRARAARYCPPDIYQDLQEQLVKLITKGGDNIASKEASQA